MTRYLAVRLLCAALGKLDQMSLRASQWRREAPEMFDPKAAKAAVETALDTE